MITAFIAGDVTNSVFAASVQPLNNVFGTDDLKLPTGHIVAKVQGNIDNSTATPSSPTTAFYAQVVDLSRGPVIPPIVPARLTLTAVTSVPARLLIVT